MDHLLRPCIYAAWLALCVAQSIDIGNIKKELKVFWAVGNYFVRRDIYFCDP
jgi:hypothetical protein